MINKEFIRELAQSVFKAMNTRDFTIFENNITNDVAFDFPGAGRIEGNKRVIIFLKALLRKYKHLTFHVNEVIASDSKACVIWTNEGENIEGISYENRGITLFYFSEDKISFISDYFKDTSFVTSS